MKKAKNKENKDSRNLTDYELESVSGGRSSEVKFFNLTKGMCECVLEINDGRLVAFSVPEENEDKVFTVTEKHLKDLIDKKLINQEVYSEILSMIKYVQIKKGIMYG